MKAYIKFITILIIAFFSTELQAESYASIKQYLNTSFFTNVEVNNVEVIYFGYRQSESDYVIDTVDTALDYSFDFLKKIYPQAIRCKNIPIRIVHIDDNILNDRDIMSFLNWNQWNNSDVYAVYDSHEHGDIYSTIYLSDDIPSRSLKTIIFHEILHYSQDMMCLDVSEKEAYNFTSEIPYLL